MSIPAVNVSLNSCQKICITASNVCTEESPYSWTTTTPSLVTVSYSGLSALIAAKPNVSGVATVVLSNNIGNPVLYVIITITNYTSLTFSTSGTNFLLSTTVTSGSPPSLNPYQISGPFNSLANPLDPDLTFFVWNQNTSAGVTDVITITNFVPGTTSRVTAFTASPSGVLAANLGLLMFQRTVDPFANPFYPLVTRVTGVKPPVGTNTISVNFNGVLPCVPTAYLPFVQFSGTQTSPDIVINGSVIDSTGRSITLISSNLQNFSVPILISIMICPKGFLNISNIGLMYCDVINVSIATPLNAVITVSLPVTIPGFATAVVFAQANDITPNAANTTGRLRIRGGNMPTASTVALNVFNQTNVAFTSPISFFIFSKTVTSGYTFV